MNFICIISTLLLILLMIGLDYAAGQSDNIMQLMKTNRGNKNFVKIVADKGVPKVPTAEAHLRNVRAITNSGTNAEAYWSNDGYVVPHTSNSIVDFYCHIV
jgi:hypothetical protein